MEKIGEKTKSLSGTVMCVYNCSLKYFLTIIGKNRKRAISKIKVSVIIPFYNRLDWTAGAIKSAIDQTHKNLEVIVVNDSSTKSLAPIMNILKADDRIKLINNNRGKGASGARNTGIDNATGEYIAFLDSDDIYSPNKIEKQLEYMVRNSYQFSHTSYNLFTDNESTRMRIGSGASDFSYPELIPNCTIATPTVMVETSIFSDPSQRFIEEYSIGEDTCLWLSLAKITTCKGMDEVLTSVRKHKNSAAYNIQKQIEGIGNILDYSVEGFLDKDSLDYILALNAEFVKLGGEDRRESIHRKLFESDNLQISDNDLVGNKFNGHELHNYLLNRGIESRQLVWNKDSNDGNTFQIARYRQNREEIYQQAESLQSQYSLNGIVNYIGYDILLDPLFLNTNLVHLHLVHNHIFDIQLLPLMSRLKPIVWTLHDPWTLGGHCIHHFDCDKWQKACGDCPNLKVPFGLERDNSALNFAIKKDAIRNSNVEIIVASKWLEEQVKRSPIFRGKKVHRIPFGINQNIFTPTDKDEAKRKLGIEEDSLVISIRCDYSGFKGMEYIEHVLMNLQSKKKVVLLILKDSLKDVYKGFEALEYGWVSDDILLARIYSASDIFLMPSTVESFGMMAIEAMSCGTLPIVLDGTALPDTVNAPECGVSTKRDKDEYLGTVQYYVDNEVERNKRARKCSEFAKTNYGTDAYIDKVITVYKEAMLKHNISEEDKFLLDQLKKNVVIDETDSLKVVTPQEETKRLGKIPLIKRYVKRALRKALEIANLRKS